jgi:hypothetical protein
MPVGRTFGLLLHHPFECLDKPSVSLFVVRRIAEDDVALAVERDAIVWGSGKSSDVS